MIEKTIEQIEGLLGEELAHNASVLLPSFIVKENNDKVAEAYMVGFINGANARLSNIKETLSKLKEEKH